jgi:hypothetical protein
VTVKKPDENTGGGFEEIGSETLDLVIDHELHGVTPEMLDWWWKNMIEPGNYKLWHPKDHVSAVWEVPPSKESNIGAIHVAEERIGEFPARKLRIRVENPASSPISATYSHVRATSIIGQNNRPVTWIVHEYQAEPYGTRMRSTFRLSANTPKQLIDALRQHNKEEMGRFSEFLPALYKKQMR